MTVFALRPEQVRGSRRSLADVPLDAVQRQAVMRPSGGALLVLGEAGHGKTVVALHRLAHLYKSAGARFRAVLLVPYTALELALQPLVTQLGADVAVQSYDHWARRQARAAFGDIPKRESVVTHTGIARLKRALALQDELEQLALLPPGRIDDDHDAPPPDTRAHAQRGDLQHLFGDAARMRALAHRIGVGDSALDALLEHTHVQFLQRAEEHYAHVDAERLLSLDAQPLDAGTPLENAESIDVEDYAVLFELDRLRAKHLGLRPTRPRAFDCIVLDEAQEFAPLELALIGRSLTRTGTLVVAGDADQHTDSSVEFYGWQATMHALRAPDFDTVTLDIGYRCPPHVTAFASALRYGQRPPPTVPALRFESEQALHAWLIEEAAVVEDQDGSASFCVIARTRATASRIAAALRGHVPVKLVLDGAFVRHRGVDVTTLSNVKGLEFDYVVVVDVDAASYDASPEARRALYVCATRACHQLALACVGVPTPLLAADMFER